MERYKILTIEDDPDVREYLEAVLNNVGYQVLSADTATDGFRLARENQPEIIILDVGLPDMSGLELCRLLRQEKETAHSSILMLTAFDKVIDKVAGLDSGADDYLAKPFDPKELVARIRALLRRANPEVKAGETIEKDDLRITVDEVRVELGGKKISGLTPREFELLCFLVRKSPKVLSRLTLLRQVWGDEFRVTERTVDATVKRLRRKLGRTGKELIQTVEGFGYRFI